MKLKIINNNNVSHCMTLLRGLVLAALLFCLIPAAFFPVLATDINSSDPVNCSGSVPSDPQWIPVEIGTASYLPISQFNVRVL